MLLALGVGLAAVAAFDFAVSRLTPTRPVGILHFGAPLAPQTPLVILFPGFSNPAHQLGLGVSAVLGPSRSVIVVDYGTSMDDDEIYETLMLYLTLRFGWIYELDVYGHSMGGQVAAMFRQRYIEEGCRIGPIQRFVMDCSPMRPSSLQTQFVPPFVLRLIMSIVWPGVVLRGLIALGNIVSRVFMKPKLDETVNRKLYQSYANAMLMFDPRAWLAQMRYMLRYGKRLRPSDETTYYICSEEPKLDGLVKQLRARTQWNTVFRDFIPLPADISHAWPMEQPQIYAGIFSQLFK